MSIKNPLTQAGIEPATFRFVAQHLNHILVILGVIKFVLDQSCAESVPDCEYSHLMN